MPWSIHRQEWKSTPRASDARRVWTRERTSERTCERTPRKRAPEDQLDWPTYRRSGRMDTARTATPRSARSTFNQWVRTPRKQDQAASSSASAPSVWPSSSGTSACASGGDASSARSSPFHTSPFHAGSGAIADGGGQHAFISPRDSDMDGSSEVHEALGDANGFLLKLTAPFAELSLRSKMLLAAQPRMEVL